MIVGSGVSLYGINLVFWQTGTQNLIAGVALMLVGGVLFMWAKHRR